MQRLKRDSDASRVSAAGDPREVGPGAAKNPAATWARLWPLFLLVAALVAATLWFALFRGRGEAIDSVAVLPFVNASADPDTEYLSDGINETLIGQLSQIPRLKVMARSTVFRYKGRM